ncbi:PEP-utilizing enzyme [Candidatus Poriferisocius sp.]|uniref:PEP-utilizing enzyme n=1 Tax=Candidatus Poriferisocius sp. TaxID=3101276 RepID=UPI003B025B7D
MGGVSGRGSPVFSGVTGRGRLVRFDTPDDVIAVLDAGDESVSETVALVKDAGATFLAPIEADLAGILCRSGDIESHLAIISRDFRIPCLMGVVFDGDEPADGTPVVIDTEAGTVLVGGSGDEGTNG